MRRNNTYSLQKINPNINTKKQLTSNCSHYQSRIAQSSPYSRLSFPKVGDSGFYGGVGRKHYEKSTQFIHKLILNADYGKDNNQIQMQRSKSQNYLKLGSESPQSQGSIKLPNIQQNRNIDSLDKLEQQINKKLGTENSPQKLIKSSEIIGRKSSLNGIYGLSNNFNIFTPIDKYYKQIHSPKPDKNQNSELYQRRFNPTYLSSDLGYV